MQTKFGKLKHLFLAGGARHCRAQGFFRNLVCRQLTVGVFLFLENL